MIIGVPKEIKNYECRVGLTPHSVAELVAHGHQVIIETQAGTAIGFSDEMYATAGADIITSAEDVFAKSEMIIKVKEPLAEERKQLRAEQTLFTYLHLAPDTAQTQDLIASGATCIAYETVTDNEGRLPLLAPMSEVAGRMSIQAGAHCLEKSSGGRGMLLGGVPGVEAAHVVVLGGGVVGSNAISMAVGLGARVAILDKNVQVLRHLDSLFGNKITTLYSTQSVLEEQLKLADLVIGSVLIPGAEAPKLITKALLKHMKPGSAIVDVAIDQGGCAETSKATTHDDPIYIVDGVVHYCVANMPGAVARTSTLALNNATLPFILALANQGPKQAMLNNPHLLEGLNVCRGHITHQTVADAHALEYVPAVQVLETL